MTIHFNPWRGCQKVSAACKNCYAETLGSRFGEDFRGKRIVKAESGWREPLKWNRSYDEQMSQFRGGFGEFPERPRVFCASLADVFEAWDGPIVDHNGIKQMTNIGCDGGRVRDLTMNDVRSRLFALIDATPNLDWLLLTKRPENIQRMIPPYSYDACLTGDCPHQKQAECDAAVDQNRHRDNLWLGTTVENQEQADKRHDELMSAASLCKYTFWSCEPLLGPVDMLRTCRNGPLPSWVIAGGESGSNARPSHPDWFLSLRDQCDNAGVPFHFKQWGEYRPSTNFDPETIHDMRIDLKGRNVTHSPDLHDESDAFMDRVGKKKAGRLLDGVEHNGMPGVTHAS